jgi:iron complex outermembrane receptor protein
LIDAQDVGLFWEEFMIFGKFGCKALRASTVLSSGLFFAAISTPAFAQNSDAGTQNAAANDSDVIIVTARKKEESLQDVPLAISVFAGEQLETARVDDVSDFLTRVPGVGFGQPFKSFSPVAIRGASTQDDSPGVDPNVAIFVDEVYLGSTTFVEFDLYDLERVEVLKGPQGTLFGRNTNGGVIHYVTRDPSDEVRARGSVTVGNFDRLEVAASISGPLSDTVYGSFSGKTRHTGGHTINLASGTRNGEFSKLGQESISSARAKLRFLPSENLDIILAADVSKDTSYGTPRYYSGDRSVNDTFPLIPDGSLRQVAQDLDGRYDREGWGVSAKVKLESEIGTFHSITSYRDYNGLLFDFDFDAIVGRTPDGTQSTEAFPFQRVQLENFSQELRWDWKIGNRITGTSGVYYLNSWQRRDEELEAFGLTGSQAQIDGAFPGPLDVLAQEVRTKSIAVFTDLTIELTDQLSLSGGIRLTNDKKEGALFCGGVGGFFCQGVFTSNFKDSWTEPSWRGILQYDVNPDVMLYGSVARGFKSGGFTAFGSGNNPATAPDDVKVPYLPEFSTSYEVGARTAWAGGDVVLNITGFHVKYTDIQFAFLDPNTFSFVADNIGSGKNTGVEVDLNVKPIDGLSIWAAYAFQDSKYGGDTLVFGDSVAGNRIQLTPKHSLSAGISYRAEFGTSSYFELSGDMVQKSRQFDDATNDIAASTKFQNLYNLRAAYGFNKNFELSIWANNLLDKRNAVGTNNLNYFIFSPAEEAAGRTALQRTLTAPRTFGLTFTATY